jgi:hypothetical protein
MRCVKPVFCLLAMFGLFMAISCDNSPSSSYFINFTLDGTNYSFKKGIGDVNSNAFGNIYTSGTPGTRMCATLDNPADFKAANSYAFIHLSSGTTAGTYDQSIATITLSIPAYYYSVTCSLTITEYGDIGQPIKGSFTGTFTNDGGATTVNGSGTFSVLRIADEAFNGG